MTAAPHTMKPRDWSPWAFARRWRAKWIGRGRRRGGGVRFGLITDLHYADKSIARGRRYRRSLAKLREAAGAFDAAGVDVVVCLGDAIDSGESVERELGYLSAVDGVLGAVGSERYYVPGNHDVERLTKREFFEHAGGSTPPYSFEAGGIHFVVLDACFRADGEPHGRHNAQWHEAHGPEWELAGLREDLTGAAGPAVIFAHQRLDLPDEDRYAVDNASAARGVIEASGKVRAVFQGHSHRNDLRRIGGVPYCTLAAVIRSGGPWSNAYAIVSVSPGGGVRVSGFGRQRGYRL